LLFAEYRLVAFDVLDGADEDGGVDVGDVLLLIEIGEADADGVADGVADAVAGEFAKFETEPG